MLLTTDVGNSHTVLGLYDEESLVARWRVVTNHYGTADELHILLSRLLQRDGFAPGDISGCCISSVVPQLNVALLQVCRDAFDVEPVMVGPGSRPGSG